MYVFKIVLKLFLKLFSKLQNDLAETRCDEGKSQIPFTSIAAEDDFRLTSAEFCASVKRCRPHIYEIIDFISQILDFIMPEKINTCITSIIGIFRIHFLMFFYII